MKNKNSIIVFVISILFLISLNLNSQSILPINKINSHLKIEMNSNKPGLFYGGGIGYASDKSLSDLGFFANVGYGFSTSFTINGELSYYSFERDLVSSIKSPKLKIITLEPDLLYTWYVPGDKAFVLIGGNANVNYLSGDKMEKSKKDIHGFDSTYYVDRDEHIKFGFGVTIGFGIKLNTKLFATAEYMARGVFGVDDTSGENSMAWGGIKLGIKYFQQLK